MPKQRISAAVLCVLVLLAALPARGKHAPLQVGDVPPPKLGRSIKLYDYQGRIVIVSFFASWCEPCRKELGVLAGIQKAATRDKLVVLLVNWQQDTSTFREIERRLKDIDLTLISDPHGSIGSQYDVNAIPHMIMVGRDGRIASIHVGYGEGQIPQLVDEINALWRQGEPPATVTAQ